MTESTKVIHIGVLIQQIKKNLLSIERRHFDVEGVVGVIPIRSFYKGDSSFRPEKICHFLERSIDVIR